MTDGQMIGWTDRTTQTDRWRDGWIVLVYIIETDFSRISLMQNADSLLNSSACNE